MAFPAIKPIYTYTDIDGRPLDDGYLYYGVANLDPEANPITVYWDAAETQPATQPIRTIGGYAVNAGVRAIVYAPSDYSVNVRNKNGSLVSTSPSELNDNPFYSDDGASGSLWTTTQEALDTLAFPLADYTALRAYTGTRHTTVRITGVLATAYPQGIVGLFQLDATDTTSADNGGTIIVDASGRRWKRVWTGEIMAGWFGVKFDNATDDYAAWLLALAAAAATVNGAQGATIRCERGASLISARLTQPNRVAIKGANGRGTVIKPHASFVDDYMIHAVNGTSSMFGALLEDLYIDARGFNMLAPVYSQAWQETSGMQRCVIQFNGTTPTGFLYANGYGGAAYLPLRDVEIFADSTAATVTGIKIEQVSVVGGFVLDVSNLTVSGTPANPVDKIIDMVNDSLVCRMVHGEYASSIVTMQGAGSLSADTITGSPNAVTDLVTIEASFTGKVNLRNMIPNGATGQIFKDNKNGRHIPVTGGMLAEYTYQPSSFLATVATDILNVTGNGTEYLVLFDTEVHDYLSEYNPATGRFTASRTGKYIVAAGLKLNIPAGSTTAVIKLVTSNRTYELYRGSLASSRDSSNNAAINGALVVDMDAADTAFISVTILGIGADTVDVLIGSTFSAQWAAR